MASRIRGTLTRTCCCSPLWTRFQFRYSRPGLAHSIPPRPKSLSRIMTATFLEPVMTGIRSISVVTIFLFPLLHSFSPPFPLPPLKARRVLGPGEEQDAAFGKLYPDQPVPATGQESRGNQNRATSSFDHRHIATSNASNTAAAITAMIMFSGVKGVVTGSPPPPRVCCGRLEARQIIASPRMRWGHNTREAPRRIECTRRAGRAGGAGRRSWR